MWSATLFKQKDTLFKGLINAFPHTTVSYDFLYKFNDHALSPTPTNDSKDTTALSSHNIGNHILIRNNSDEATNIRDKKTHLQQRWELKFSPRSLQPSWRQYLPSHASVEFCIVPALPLDMYIFKFAARRSAEAVTFPLPVLICTAYSQYCSLVCLWLLSTANFITSIRKLNPKEQSSSSEHSLAQSQCLNVTLQTP